MSKKRLQLKIAVYLILIQKNKVLLSRRFNTGWQDGNYSLPAGHVEANEKIVDALLREAEEEIGIQLNTKTLRFAHCMYRRNIYTDFYFTASKWKGEPKNMEPNKSDRLKWFPIKALPRNIVPSVKYAILNFKKGIPFSDSELE